MSRSEPLAALTDPVRVVRTDGLRAEVEDDTGLTSVCLRSLWVGGHVVRPGDWILTTLGVAVAPLDADDERVQRERRRRRHL